MKLPSPQTALIGAGLVLAAFAAVYVWRRGVFGAASDIGRAAINAVDGVVTGAQEQISETIGITPPSLTITDTDKCSEYAGQYGWLSASERCSAGALAGAALKGKTYYGNEGRR